MIYFLSKIWEVCYVVYYYYLGTFAIIEDMFNRSNNKCKLEKKPGDVAVITGGARGIGAEVVKQLLQCDMHIIIGCRNVSKGSDMVRKLRQGGITSGSTSILPLDMACLDSIQAFATAVLQAKPKLHLLINNAGIMFPPYEETVDGFESQWGVNYLGHFLLTHLLLSRLHETATSDPDHDRVTRVVNVSSCAHHASYPINFADINMKKGFVTQAAYAQSKLAQIMFTQHLDRLLQQISSRVRVVAVHPGMVNTDIFEGTFMKIATPWAPGLLFKTPEEGATTIMFAALHGRGGSYVSNCRESAVSKEAVDLTTQMRLFEYSKHHLGIKSFGSLL